VLDLIKITLRPFAGRARGRQAVGSIIRVLDRVPIVEASGRNCCDDEWN